MGEFNEREYQEEYKIKNEKHGQDKKTKGSLNKMPNNMPVDSKVAEQEPSKSNKETKFARSYDNDYQRDYKGRRYDRSSETRRFNRDNKQNRDYELYRRGRSQDNNEREYQEEYKIKNEKNNQDKKTKESLKTP